MIRCERRGPRTQGAQQRCRIAASSGFAQRFGYHSGRGYAAGGRLFCFVMDWRMGLIALIPAVLYMATLSLMSPRDNRGVMDQLAASFASVSEAIVDYVGGVAVLKIFGRAKEGSRRFRKTSNAFISDSRAARRPANACAGRGAYLAFRAGRGLDCCSGRRDIRGFGKHRTGQGAGRGAGGALAARRADHLGFRQSVLQRARGAKRWSASPDC